MPNASRDQNHVPSMIASSSADGKTVVAVAETSNYLATLDGTSGTDFGNDAAQDQNRVTVAFGVSSADGVTPTAIYADPTTGSLLIRST